MDLRSIAEILEESRSTGLPFWEVILHYDMDERQVSREESMAKMLIKQAVYNQNGVLCAEGVVTLGFLNKETFMPMRCPEPVVELFEKFINA